MILLIFDVETTGLIKGRNVNVEDTHKFPYIVQFSWVMYDTDTNKLKFRDYIVKLPNNVVIPKESINIHGITDEVMRKDGKDIKLVLRDFTNSIYRSDVLIAHNLNFDKKVIQAEYIRNEMINWFSRHRKKEYCTMLTGKPICKLYRTGRYNNVPYMKYPTLMELHKHLFNSIPKNLHNSLIDVMVSLRCYYQIEYDNDIFKKDKYFSFMYNQLCYN